MKRVGLDPVTRGWAVVTSAGVVRLGLGFVASLLIARALGPANFGVYAVLAATVGIVATLAEGGLTEAAVLRISSAWPVATDTAETRARSFFWFRLGLSAIVVGLGCAFAGAISSRILNDVDAGLLRWALIGIVATAASGALSAILQATGGFGRMSSLTLINTGLTAGLALVLAAIGRLDLLTALIVLGIGTSLVTFALAVRMLPAGWRLNVPSRNAVYDEAKRLLETGRWLWIASLFAMFTANAEVLLLNQWIALSLVGAYALALNLATKADLVNQSLYTVLLPGVANLDVRTRLRGYVRHGLLRSVAICLVLLVLIPLARPLIVLIYGPAYEASVIYFQLLLGVMIFDVLLTPLLLLPLAYRQPKVLAAADGTRAVTLVALAVALIPIYGPFGAIAARFAARVAGAVLVLAVLYVTSRSGRQAFEVQHKEAARVLE
ncbi:MAG: oligosaccharide flippase family protein [Chloroflexi bacterium]|nr:oligosaccharide flippase family protein [Chloroflexota bacterium]